MLPTQDTYPVFEANQVLTNTHLNQVFNYLDKQERLTRTHLIGIGIVCGLDIRVQQTAEKTVIQLTKGCGITSKGYLILEPEDVSLEGYRDHYVAPADPDNQPYQAFIDPGTSQSYPLWELFPAGEPGTKTLSDPANFLDDKAVLLFLELKPDNLRNCSPVSCDDKGITVTATVRRLLVTVTDLAKIIGSSRKLETSLTTADIEASLLNQLNLPDLRLPRFDVPNTQPATSQDVLAAFHTVFHETKLVQQMANALTAAYGAFRSVISTTYGDDPFTQFTATFGFLDTVPTTTAQVRFLPYYYDFFGDLLQAYDEFRWKGVALLCACCPDADLFPRHLMAGVLKPGSDTNASLYRHRFMGSSAVSGCEELTQELEQLFQRLVEMIAQFTPTPIQLKVGTASDEQIRITPSKLADVSLSAKAIPYYYQQTGTPPLFQIWNAQKRRRNRANQNLSYRSDEYNPTAPAFVTNPLRYDLEPYNFLRIEGHIGKDYQSVLSTLLTLKARFRLPIDIIALRTGAFDETMPIDLSKEKAKFQDLEALYDALREELLSALAEGIRFLYGMKNENAADPGGTAQLPLLKKYAPNVGYAAGTVGAWFEHNLARLTATPYIDIDQTNITDTTVGLTVYCRLFAGTVFPDSKVYPHIVSIFYFTKLAEILPDSLDQLGFAEFENRYQDLLGLTRYFRNLTEKTVAPDLAQFLPQEELLDQFNQVLFGCKLEPIRSLFDEYKRRLKEIKQKLFLSTFLQTHPGIQHKAGVPMGGTFILVYHDDPDPVIKRSLADLAVLRTDVLTPRITPEALQSTATLQSTVNSELLSKAFLRISKNPVLTDNDDIRLVLGSLIGVIPPKSSGRPPVQEDAGKKIISQTVGELVDGTVIADFYLPYLYSSGAAPVQFVLPKVKPSFTYEIGCTNENDQAEVTLTPQGGVPPYSVKVDNDDYIPLDGALSLAVGSRKLLIQDAETTESNPQTIRIRARLTTSEPEYTCLEGNTYSARFTIRGGQSPYTAIPGTIQNTNEFTVDGLPGDQPTQITINDTAGSGYKGCQTIVTLQKSCLPPLDFALPQIGCTTSNNEAPVTMSTPTGGTSPYKLQIDQGEPMDIGESVNLPVGQHTLTVTDSVGSTPVTKTIEIPARITLTVDEAEYRCADGKYQALVHIAGGTPPYFYLNAAGEKQPVNEAAFATDPFPSGEETTIQVSDSNPANCDPVTIVVKHTCEAPCDLPCGGVSQRYAYRLWLQPSTGNKYISYKPQTIKFQYNGTAFEFPADLVFTQVAKLNSDFNNAMGDIIKRLNQAIADKIGQGRIELSYRPDDKDPFALLYIEFFVCETFTLSFDYSVAMPDPQQNLNILYSNAYRPQFAGAVLPPFNGAIFTNQSFNNKQTIVPAFLGSERNQCNGSEYKNLCEGTDAKVTATADALGGSRLRLIARGNDIATREVVAWVWDIRGALPTEPFYTGQTVDAQVVLAAVLAAPTVTVRLTAITQKGCFVTSEKTTRVS